MTDRIVVLGGRGFIGRAVMNDLAAADWAAPHAASRHSTDLRLDATDAVQLSKALHDCSGIVNCVGGSATTMRANADALAAALRTAAPALRIVHLSSMAVYGPVTGLIDETAPLDTTLGDYAAAKVYAEQALRAVRPDTIILRPGIVYGSGSPQWTIRIARLLEARRLGDLGANGDGYCNLVHTQDVAGSVTRCLQSDDARGSSFNLSMPDPPTWNQYLTRFALQMRAVPVRRIGARRLRIESVLLAPPLKILEIGLERLHISTASLPPPIPPSFLRLCRQEIRLDTRRAEATLGLRWMPLEAGLAEAARSCARR